MPFPKKLMEEVLQRAGLTEAFNMRRAALDLKSRLGGMEGSIDSIREKFARLEKLELDDAAYRSIREALDMVKRASNLLADASTNLYLAPGRRR